MTTLSESNPSDPRPPPEAVVTRALGLAQFEAGDFASAQSTLTEAVDSGVHDADVVSILAGLIADQDGAISIAGFYADIIERFGPFLHPSILLDWEREKYDALRIDPTLHLPLRRTGAALDLLGAAATAGDWNAVVDRRADLESIFSTPTQRLDLLEQFSYAPSESGLPSTAAAEIEAIGFRFAHEGDSVGARSVERLLHGLGSPDAAYGIERVRRGTNTSPGRHVLHSDEVGEFDGVTVLIAGGHPPLRRLVSVDLTRSGATGVREVPSKWEAVQAGRTVRDRMAGSDLAVLIGRQLAHSTADQVRTAAAKFGIPVVRAETAGVGSVRRAALGARR